jgi:hypothetical protein
MKSSTIASLPDVTLRCAEAIYAHCNAHELDYLLDQGDFASIIRQPFPDLFSSSFPEDHQASELLSKYPFEIGIDRDAVCIESFRVSEKACAAFNSVSPWLCPSVAPAVLRRARGKIRALLGEFSWSEAVRYCGFGPGASTSLSRVHGHGAYKFGNSKPDVTPNCLPVAGHLLRSFFPAYWLQLVGYGVGDPAVQLADRCNVVRGNRLTTVPKNAKTNRAICIEPDLNMFFQKGIGGLIRKRLKRCGLDLNTQQEVNRRLAGVGSQTGSLATIDLKAASDSVSLGLCELLLPDDWLDAIVRTRSPVCELPDGTPVPLEKVSSMGNGFTFELESLIFLALAWAVSPKMTLGVDLAVYGDDLIVPTDVAGPLIRALDVAGFQTNASKTFIEGPFRESCGKHYWRGIDVTPIYLRKPVDTIFRVFWFVNSVSRKAARDGWRCSSYLPLYEAAISLVPSSVRTRFPIPDGVGDGGIITPFDQARPSRAPGQWCNVYNYRQLVSFNKTERRDGAGPFLASLHQLEKAVDGDYSPGVPSKGIRVKAVRSLCHGWSDPGPWL